MGKKNAGECPGYPYHCRTCACYKTKTKVVTEESRITDYLDIMSKPGYMDRARVEELGKHSEKYCSRGFDI